MSSGLFIKLDVAYYDDEAILEVSEAAELLFIRALCRMKQLGTDGYLSARQLDRIAPRLGTDSVTDSVTDLAGELVRVGLWVEEARGYRCRSWLKYNDPMSVVESQRKGGAVGNHIKWHVKQGKYNSDCQYCIGLIGTDSVTDIGSDRYTESTETETETETETSLKSWGALAQNAPPVLAPMPDLAIVPSPKAEENPTPKPKTARRRTQAPESFPVTDDMRKWAEGVGFVRSDLLERETEKFLDYYRGKGTPMKDWLAAWRNWIRKSLEFRAEKRGDAPEPDGLSKNPFFKMMQQESAGEHGFFFPVLDMDASVGGPGDAWHYPRALGGASGDS